MQRVSVALRERLGEDGARDLEEFTAEANSHWSDHVMQMATGRFESRMAAVGADLRLEMQKGFADLRAEISGLRLESAEFRAETQKGFGDLRVELLRWSFFFWIGQVVAIASLLAFMLRGVK